MIDLFRGEFDFLSNFYLCKVRLYGQTYPSAEHAYQAAKCVYPSGRAAFRRAGVSSGMAKLMGRQIPCRPGWDAIKLEVMRHVLYSKFAHLELKRKLLETAPHHLEEGNTWGDTYWGVYGGSGQNNLGKLLMEVRDANSTT